MEKLRERGVRSDLEFGEGSEEGSSAFHIEGEPLGVMEFSNVAFSEKSPESAKFAKPADALVAPLE